MNSQNMATINYTASYILIFLAQTFFSQKNISTIFLIPPTCVIRNYKFHLNIVKNISCVSNIDCIHVYLFGLSKSQTQH